MGHKSNSIPSACMPFTLTTILLAFLAFSRVGCAAPKVCSVCLIKPSAISLMDMVAAAQTQLLRNHVTPPEPADSQISPYVNDGAWLKCLLYLMLVKKGCVRARIKDFVLCVKQWQVGQICTQRGCRGRICATCFESSLLSKETALQVHVQTGTMHVTE